MQQPNAGRSGGRAPQRAFARRRGLLSSDQRLPDRPSSSAAGNRRGVKSRSNRWRVILGRKAGTNVCRQSNGPAVGRDRPALPHRQPEERKMIAAISVFSQRRAFRRSTSIARRWGHKSIWATRSALVFALRLLRLCRAAIGPYWRLPATEYQSGHKKAARGSLQPELAFPSERKVSGQSTNIARRWGRRSILATLSVPVLRNLRRARVKELAAARGGGCPTRGGS